MKLKVLSLFAGIGGLELGLEMRRCGEVYASGSRASFRLPLKRCAVRIRSYCTRWRKRTVGSHDGTCSVVVSTAPCWSFCSSADRSSRMSGMQREVEEPYRMSIEEKRCSLDRRGVKFSQGGVDSKSSNDLENDSVGSDA